MNFQIYCLMKSNKHIIYFRTWLQTTRALRFRTCSTRYSRAPTCHTHPSRWASRSTPPWPRSAVGRSSHAPIPSDSRCACRRSSFQQVSQVRAFSWFVLMDFTFTCSLSFQPVLHDWCSKGRRMCYPVWGIMHINIYKICFVNHFIEKK